MTKLKILMAIILVVVGAGIFISKYKKIHPELKYEPPKAQIEMEQKVEEANKYFTYGLKTLNLTKDQEQKLDSWIKWNAKDKSKEEKKAHNDELKKILNDEQIKKFKELRDNKSSELKKLKKDKEEKFKRMLGDADFQKHQENMKKIKEQKNKGKTENKADKKRTEKTQK